MQLLQLLQASAAPEWRDSCQHTSSVNSPYPFPCAHTPSHRAGNTAAESRLCEETLRCVKQHLPRTSMASWQSPSPSQAALPVLQRPKPGTAAPKVSQHSVHAHLPACVSASQILCCSRTFFETLNTSQIAARKIILK